LRRVDDRVELLDAEHAHVGNACRAALIFAGWSLPSLARPARSIIWVLIAEIALLAASATIGVMSPPSMLTATEMSARLYLMSVSPAKLTLHSGTSISASGERLDQHVVDAELDIAAGKAGVEFAAQLEQCVEADVDRQIDVRDLLLRFGQPARDGLAHVAELDALVRDVGSNAACFASPG
jgi:hypothetical protein